MTEWKKPLPTISGETRPFWDACRRGELLIQRCRNCGEYQFYPRGICANCWTTEIAWVKASGKGTVWSYTVTRQNRTAGFADDVPYVVALIELEEGVKIFTNIVTGDSKEGGKSTAQPGTPHLDISIGMPVEVTFLRATDQISIPYFRPVT